MQATAPTPETPRSARETLLAEQGGLAGFLQPDVNLNAPRYFVQLGFSMASLATHAIPTARLWRGEIAPCRTIAVVDNIHAIPETARIPGSERAGADGKIATASYRSYAYHEAERILSDEASTSKKSTIFEIESLRSDLGDRVYRELDVTKLFFPDWPNMPERNEDVAKFLADRLEVITASPPRDIPPEVQSQVMEILRGVGAELIQIAGRTQEIQREEIVYTHHCMRMEPKEERYKPRYDSRDYEILKRTGLPQVDEAELQTAQSLNILAKQATGSGGDNAALLKLVESQQEANALLRMQLEQQGQALQILLAERQSAKTEAPAAEAPKNQPPKGK